MPHGKLPEAGSKRIRTRVGTMYQTLYPFQCPSGGHWHLSSARQGAKRCDRCGERRPAWYDSRGRVWVIYKHGECVTAQWISDQVRV